MIRQMYRLIKRQPFLCRMVPPAAVFCFLAWCAVSVRADFSWDDADPEVLNQAWRLARGQSIYRGIEAPPYTFAAYTPVYYALAALAMKFSGLSFIPARLISLSAALSIGWALVILSRRWKNNAAGGIWTAFFLFLVPAFLYNMTRSNVQMAAVAFSLWSLVFFLGARRSETVILSALLAVLAFYTKQTQIALPLAMIVYLALRNRRWLLPYTATLAVAGAVPFFWLQQVTGGNFFLNTVRLANLSYHPWQIPLIFMHHAGPVSIFIFLALMLSAKKFRHNAWGPLDCYLISVFAVTGFSLGRIGAHGQYVLELVVVTLVYLLWADVLPAVKERPVLVSIQVLLLFLYAPFFVFIEEGLWDMRANKAAHKVYRILATRPGPILSQQGSFPLFSRGEIFIQLFHFTALSRAGLWDQNRLAREIEHRSFAFVITEFSIDQPDLPENARERFTPEMIEALRKNYRHMQAIDPYYLYVPRAP